MKFAPVPAREHAIVWEIRPDEARGALFEFGMEQRVILRRSLRALRGEALPSLFKLKQFRKVPVVVSLYPSLARTFILPFKLVRKKGEGPINPESLQTMLRDFLSKTTFEMRRLAAEALGVEELDAILLDARLTHVLADGVETRDDRLIEGRRIEGFLQATWATRAVFHDLHDLLHSGRELFFTERGSAALAFLARHRQGPLVLLDLEDQGGWLLRFDKEAEEILKKSKFSWDAEELPGALAAAWGISAKAARDAYAMFLRGELSRHTSGMVEKALAPLKESFDRALAKSKTKGIIYVRSTLPLPFALPALRGVAQLEGMPLATLLEQSGLSFSISGSGDAEEASFLLMPFLEYYYHRGDPGGHKVLTRHIHWISS